MTTDTIPIPRRPIQRGLSYSAGLAVVWLIAAAFRPEVTYHLAPMLVAGALPVAMALDRDAAPGMRALALAAGAGFLLAAIVALLLAAVGWLEGPTLGPFTSALAESIAGAALGAAAGFLAGALWRR
jgi:hypothetical protein